MQEERINPKEKDNNHFSFNISLKLVKLNEIRLTIIPSFVALQANKGELSFSVSFLMRIFS